MNKITKMLLKFAGKAAMPTLKEQALKYIESEKLQKKFVKMINKKLDIPDVSEEMEKKLIDASYDVVQELAKQNIDKIDLNKLLENI